MVEEFIDVDIPYYFKHQLSDNSIMYGKRTESYDYAITINENDMYDKIVYEIEMEKYNGDSSYFDPKYKTSEEEFNKIVNEALIFFNDNFKEN